MDFITVDENCAKHVVVTYFITGNSMWVGWARSK